jgi:3-hydroxyacyl-CoA dehydrogenase
MQTEFKTIPITYDQEIDTDGFLHFQSVHRLPRIRNVQPDKIRTVAVLGLGVMGSGIANLLLRNGYDIILWEVNEDALQRGLQGIRKTFADAMKKGEMAEADLDRLLTRKTSASTRIEDVADADLVIEAVLENMEIKKSIWHQVDEVCSSRTALATNALALPVTELAEILGDPRRMLGFHFFAPAERTQLLEIICGEKTSDSALATAVSFARRIKKIPVVVNDGPGFYISRQMNALMGECNFMLEEGIPMQLIDGAMLDFGMPMGPFALHDLTGIDIGFQVARNFARSFGARWQVSVLHEQIYQTGCHGRKTGAGYYDYRGAKPVPNPVVVDVIQAYLNGRKILPKKVPPRELTDRMLARAINEAAYMMEEKICDRPQDMDLAMVYGCGYPSHRGGILKDADSWGIDSVLACLGSLEKKYGLRFKPSKLLKKMAKTGERFYDVS